METWIISHWNSKQCVWANIFLVKYEKCLALDASSSHIWWPQINVSVKLATNVCDSTGPWALMWFYNFLFQKFRERNRQSLDEKSSSSGGGLKIQQLNESLMAGQIREAVLVSEMTDLKQKLVHLEQQVNVYLYLPCSRSVRCTIVSWIQIL